jgi:hypothetical protein
MGLRPMLRDDDIRTDIGRCTGGSFVRVVHLPTGISRIQGPLGGQSVQSVEGRMLVEIEQELSERGLSEYIVLEPPGPDDRLPG